MMKVNAGEYKILSFGISVNFSWVESNASELLRIFIKQNNEYCALGSLKTFFSVSLYCSRYSNLLGWFYNREDQAYHNNLTPPTPGLNKWILQIKWLLM